MLRLISILLLFGLAASAQIAPTPAPSPAGKSLIDSLSPADVEQMITLLKANFINPEALKDQELNRATLEGLLARLHGGALLVPQSATSAESATPFYAEVLAAHIGYARIGSIEAGNLREFDKALADFTAKKLDALIVDLRASSTPNDFNLGAEFAGRVIPKGKLLWRLRKAASPQDRVFTNERDPGFQGTMIVLIDGDTAGPAEAIAEAIRDNARAITIGQTSAGRAVEYAEFNLAAGRIFRIATTAVIGPDGSPLFPRGVKPDLAVEMAAAEKRQIFAQSAQRGISSYVFEVGRPHFNEAALMAGTNPELDAARRNKSNDSLHDPVLQRAVDVITSIAIFEKH